MSVRYSARIPPINAKDIDEDQRGVFHVPNALKSNTKTRKTLIGTITLSLAIARCWFGLTPSTCRRWAEPLPFTHDLGPPRQIDVVVEPLDELSPARSKDFSGA
jgi:hypothetical protein